ncbi:Vps51p [Nakaseomyces bracarensis]|uniref:Vps51p n=1 Tax=Nakaseomyces bracarensis TaxID=273131 RepID=UPI0038717703
MAEQISHKKSLRTGKDKRSLLKEYYHLNNDADLNDAKEVVAEVQNKEVDAVEEKEGKEEEEEEEEEEEDTLPKKLDVLDRPINEQTFRELVATHNKLLGKETATNSSIKNTIYENYYDLVKVNDKLEELNNEKLQGLFDTLKNCVEASL